MLCMMCHINELHALHSIAVCITKVVKDIYIYIYIYICKYAYPLELLMLHAGVGKQGKVMQNCSLDACPHVDDTNTDL